MSKIPAPLSLPPGVTKVYVVCRQSTLADDWIAHQEYPSHIKVRKIYYLDEDTSLIAKPETLFVALQLESDPISFKEAVGREKLFFKHQIILKFW